MDFFSDYKPSGIGNLFQVGDGWYFVFACTGFTHSFYQKIPFLDFFGVRKGGFVNTLLYLLLVLPLYQIFRCPDLWNLFWAVSNFSGKGKADF